MPTHHAHSLPSFGFLALTATLATTLLTPTDVQMPGTQPGQVNVHGNVGQCDNCHGNYAPAHEPAHNWQGSMMAHAGRDPLFWAALGVVETDVPGAGDFCLRCHAPRGWLEGRSVPADGSGLLPAQDGNGIECSICHALTNPNGLEHQGAQTAPFLAHDGGTPPRGYHGSGMMVLAPTAVRLGPYGNVASPHQSAQSLFHRSAELCGTCHDVSNPFVGDLAHNHGAQVPLPPGRYSGVPNAPVTQKAAFLNFPHQYGVVERTFSEHQASAFATLRVRDYGTLPAELQRGALAHAREQALLAGNQGDYADGAVRTFTCQTCHMAPVVGAGATGGSTPVRTDLPLHDLTGANTRVPDMIRWLDGQNRLRIGGGITAAQSAAMDAGIVRARQNLQRAAALDVRDDTLHVVNLTGHKLITGYPEGRRMWLRLRWRNEQGALLREDGAYGARSISIPGLPATVHTLLDPYARRYDAVHGMTQQWAAQLLGMNLPASLPLEFDAVTGNVTLTLGQLAAMPAGTTHETFHFVLNNTVLSDTRIPPYGFRHDEARARNALPVPSTQYGNPGPGGTYRHWDEVPLQPPAGATRAEIDLLYQTTSWEYILFLLLANTGSSQFLATAGYDAFDAWYHTGMSPPETMASARWCRLPGTGEDLALRTGIAGRTPDTTCAKDVAAGETVRFEMASPGGRFHGTLGALIFQVHGAGGAPAPTLPGLQLDHYDLAVLALPLLPAGMHHDLPIPPGFSGAIVRAQAIVLTDRAQNGIYATSSAHDVLLR